MCSIIDFIAKQNHLIKSRRKRIQSLHHFLDSIDGRDVVISSAAATLADNTSLQQKQQKSSKTNGEKVVKTLPKESGDSADLMLEDVQDLFGWMPSKKYEDSKRRQLGEERRQDYQDFLQQKSRNESDIQKKRYKREIRFETNYKDLLNKKRIEEQKRREVNGLEDMDIDPDLDIEEGLQNGYSVPIVGQFYCSNNKFNDDYITPRSRLLASHSSRLKAQKYSEELRKQCEEKQKMKDEEKRRIKLEDEEEDLKLDIQRLKLLREFETEKKLLRQKLTERSPVKHDNSRHSRDMMAIPASPLLRSPTYMHVNEKHLTANGSPVINRSKAPVSRSLVSAMNRSMKSSQPSATTSANSKPDLNSGQYFSANSEPASSDDEPNDEKTEEVQFRRRVLSQLSDVRQMMENDHILMMEELRHQQQQQMDQ